MPNVALSAAEFNTLIAERDALRGELLGVTGVWLCLRRLHHGRFTWPHSDGVACALSAEQWRWLTCGIDGRRLQAKPTAQWQV